MDRCRFLVEDDLASSRHLIQSRQPRGFVDRGSRRGGLSSGQGPKHQIAHHPVSILVPPLHGDTGTATRRAFPGSHVRPINNGTSVEAILIRLPVGAVTVGFRLGQPMPWLPGCQPESDSPRSLFVLKAVSMHVVHMKLQAPASRVGDCANPLLRNHMCKIMVPLRVGPTRPLENTLLKSAGHFCCGTEQHPIVARGPLLALGW